MESLKIQRKKDFFPPIFDKGKNVISQVQTYPFVALRLESLDKIFGKTSSSVTYMCVTLENYQTCLGFNFFD